MLKWATSGEMMSLALVDKILVQTTDIKKFIDDSQQYFISAAKGSGKTLVLKSKRRRLLLDYAEGDDQEQTNAVFIPEGRPYLDSMTGNVPALPKTHVAFLSELRNCRELWSFALRASILSHFPDHFAMLDEEKFSECAGLPMRHIVRVREAATDVFLNLVGLSLICLNRLLREFDTNIEMAFRHIRTTTCAFIDGVERGIPHLPRDPWMRIQEGLIEAAFDLMSQNHYVKVFGTIRQEAFNNRSSTAIPAVHPATLSLRYNHRELREIIDNLCKLYEAVPGFDGFVEMSSVLDIQWRLKEAPFAYLLRHTLGRPRDLVIISSAVSQSRRRSEKRQFEDVVREASAEYVASSVFREQAMFLECLRDVEELNRFLMCLPCNVLTRSELQRIYCEFNGLSSVDVGDRMDELYALTSHPFCELYNCGLLGIVNDSPGRGRACQQQFTQPHDALSWTRLPDSDYYFLHPAIDSLLCRRRAESGYYTVCFVTVGHEYPWWKHHGALVDLQRLLLSVNDDHLRSNVLEFAKSTLSDSDGKASASTIDYDWLEQIQAKLRCLQYDEVCRQLDTYIAVIKM